MKTTFANAVRLARMARTRFAVLVAYVLAVALPLVAVGMRLAGDSWLGEHPVLTAFLLPIVVSAYVGGLGPGLLATGLVAVGTNYFILSPRHSLDIVGAGDLLAWAAMILTGVLISALMEVMHRARKLEPGLESVAIEWKVHTGFVVVLVMLCASAYLSYYSILQMETNLAAAKRSELMVDSIKAVMVGMRDIETDAGRFVITGEPSHIAHFDAAGSAVSAELAHLRGMVADDPDQQLRLNMLAPLAARRIAVGRGLIEMRRRAFEPARAAIAGGEGKVLLDEMRSVAAEMERAQGAIGREREHRSGSYVAMTRGTVILGGALAFMFMLAAMYVVHRDFAGRRRADAALLEAHDLLEARVRERTEDVARGHHALKEREQQLAGIVFSAVDAIITIDEKQRIVLFNAAAERMFGRSGPDAVGRPLDELLPARFRGSHGERVREFGLARVTSRSMGAALEIFGQRADGSEFPLEVSISLADRGGTKLFTAILRDITERKRSEEALRASETQLRLVTDSVPALIARIGSDGRYRYVNKAYAQFWGSTGAGLVGRTVKEVVGADNHRLIAADLVAAAGGRTVSFERTLVFEGGEKRIVGGCVVPDMDADGHVRGVFVAVNDLTEQKHTEALLQRTEKMEALGTLAGGIAHDFNNILPAIRGFAAMAADDLPRGHPAHDKLAHIETAARRASDLVRRILAFSRPQERATQRIDLESAIREALKFVRSTLPAMIAIRTDFPAGLPEIDADPTEVYQIVVNLLANAAHAIGSNAGLIELRLEEVCADGQVGLVSAEGGAKRYLKLTVGDSGCGMDAATQARIFDPFFTTKPVGEGTGLGLSIIHGIMKKAGGAITVDSTPGSGARFQLYFPIGEDGSRIPGAASSEVRRGSGQRILYVDDEEPLVFLAGYMLKRLGYEVIGVTSAVDALREFRARPGDFDAVITDLSMPGMSGFDVAREVLAIRGDTPIIMASGYVRPEDEERARALGVREVVCKPSTVEEYAQVIDRLLRGGDSAP